jgi:hypothetical protein
MILNAKPAINQKTDLFSPPLLPADCRHLQHLRTLMGLSRQRLTPDDALRLIDSRQVRWAWDISRKGSRRPEVRIWRASLLAYLAGENGGATELPPEQMSLTQVIEAILPKPWALTPRAAAVSGRELQRRFLCCSGHLAGLIADGELSCVGPKKSRETPAILHQSAVEFLKRRSMSA